LLSTRVFSESICKFLGPYGLNILPNIKNNTSKAEDKHDSVSTTSNYNSKKISDLTFFNNPWDKPIEVVYKRAYFKFIHEGIIQDCKLEEQYSFSDAIYDFITALEFLGVLTFTRISIQHINNYSKRLIRAAELSSCLLAIPLSGPSLWFPQPNDFFSKLWETVLPELLGVTDSSQLSFSTARAIGCAASWTLLMSSFVNNNIDKDSIILFLNHLSLNEEDSNEVQMFDPINQLDPNYKFVEHIVQLELSLDSSNEFKIKEFDIDAPITPSSSPTPGYSGASQSFSTNHAFLEGFLHNTLIYEFLES